MADQVDDQPAFPDSTNWSEWTFALALRAVTGDNVDLRPLSNAEWFIFNPAGVNQPGGADEVGYQAFGIQYYGARINHTAIDAFETAADQLDPITTELIDGRRGTADVQTLTRLHEEVLDLEAFLDTSSAEFRRRAGQLESGATDLAGTAAQLMHDTLDKYANLLELWADRLPVTPTLLLSTAVRHARDDLYTFSVETGNAWQAERQAGIRTRIRDAVAAETATIRNHLVSQGVVVGTPQFTFDQWDPTKKPGLIVTPADLDAFTARTRAAIEAAVASYPKGDLRQAATWTRINKDITATVSGSLDNLDRVARKFLEPLYESYLTLNRGLKPLGQASKPADSGAPQAGSPTPDAPPPGPPAGTPQPTAVVGPPSPGGLAPPPDPSSSAFPTGSANGAQPAPDGTGPNGTVPGSDGSPLPDPRAQPADQPAPSSASEGQPPAAGVGQLPLAGDGQPPLAGNGQPPLAGNGQSPLAGNGQSPFAGDGQSPLAGDGQSPLAGGAAPAPTSPVPIGSGGSRDPNGVSAAGDGTLAAPPAPFADGSLVDTADPLAIADATVPVADPAGGAVPTAIPLASMTVGGSPNPNGEQRRRATVSASAGDAGVAVSPAADGSLAAPNALPGDGSAVGDTGGTVHLDRTDPAGGPGPSVRPAAGHVVAGGLELPLPRGTAHGAGGLNLLAAAGNAEFGMPGWDGRVGGDGAAGRAQVSAGLPGPGAQVSYRGSGYWPTGQYGSLPTQLAGSPVPVSGAGMPYLPAIGGRGGLDRGRERRTWLVEDEEVWGAAPTAGGAVVGPLEVDEYLDSDQLVATGGPAGAQPGGAVHVVAGHGDDEDQFRYPGDGGQLP